MKKAVRRSKSKMSSSQRALYAAFVHIFTIDEARLRESGHTMHYP
jgi:hypothetical protein